MRVHGTASRSSGIAGDTGLNGSSSNQQGTVTFRFASLEVREKFSSGRRAAVTLD